MSTKRRPEAPRRARSSVDAPGRHRSARVERSPAARSRARGSWVRPHVTLGMLTGMFTPGLTGHDNPLRADGVWLFENDSLTFYHLRSDGVRWTRLAAIRIRARASSRRTSAW